MTDIKPIFGTTKSGTWRIIDLWVDGYRDDAVDLLMTCITVNSPETPNNTPRMARDTIEKYIEEYFSYEQ